MTTVLGTHAPKPDSRMPEQRVIAAAQRALKKGKGPAEVLRVMVFANAGRLSPEALERLFREQYTRHRTEEFHKCGEGIISSADLLARAVQRAPDMEASQRWGLHVRAQAVTQFVGETSAGKTVFLYNLAHHLATGKEFLGITPPRPLRVLHLDFESYDDICREHLEGIGTVAGWDFWDPDELQDIDRGPSLVDAIERRIITDHYDVAIIDPLMDAYPCDENDNTVAAVQMLAFRRVGRRTGAAIVLAHNTGLRTKAPTSRTRRLSMATNKYLGRGATARVDKADVSINFVVLTEAERYLYVAKSRAGNLNENMVLRFAGDFGYALEPSVEDQMAIDRFAVIQAFVGSHGPVVHSGAIVEHLESLGCKPRTTERALALMKRKGLLKSLVKGQWMLPTAKAAA